MSNTTVPVSAFFTQSGIPATGLSPTPTVTIKNVTDNIVTITSAVTTDIGNGFYSYNFTTYDSRKLYTVVFDGGVTFIDTERYQYTTIAPTDHVVRGDIIAPETSRIGQPVIVDYQSSNFNPASVVTLRVLDELDVEIGGSPFTMTAIASTGLFKMFFVPTSLGVYKVFSTEDTNITDSQTILITNHDLDTIGSAVDAIAVSPAYSSGGYAP